MTIDETTEYQAQPASQDAEQTPEQRSKCALVKKWNKRIKKARKKWDADFKRMKANMEFAAGFQWEGQTEVDDARYIANQVNPLVNQKVSLLYAKDPKSEAVQRERLDFQIWDGKMESLQQAQVMLAANPQDPAAMALMVDYAAGRQRRDLIDRVGKTLQITYKWQLDNQETSFKLQMKQLVRRVVTCCVGYVKLSFARDFAAQLNDGGMDSGIQARTKAAVAAAEEAVADAGTEGSIDMLEEARMLATSLQASVEAGDMADVNERLVIEFPPATSIIPDPNCRALKGFLSAQWIAQQYILPLSVVETFFETKLSGGEETSGVVYYNEDGAELEPGESAVSAENEPQERMVCVFEVFEKSSKNHFYVCDGYKYFLQDPEPLVPQTKRFWPLFPLTFNDIEAEPGQKSTIFPPSDVQLIKHAQKEWNRTRQSLRNHRRANAPKYLAAAGVLTDEDKANLKSAAENAVIELVGAVGAGDVTKVVAPFVHSPIDPSLYETLPLQQDIRATLGSQEGALPASSKSTATAATINEQQRIVTQSSNVDDLDDLLSDLAEAASEIMLREMSEPVVKRIAGPGAVWPTTDRLDFVNEVYLTVVAASSGRPNKALEVANFTQLAPLIAQAGGSPHFIIREGVKRLDDRLRPEDAFPLGLAPGSAPPMESPNSAMSGESTPTPQNQNPAGYIKQPNVERPPNVPEPKGP